MGIFRMNDCGKPLSSFDFERIFVKLKNYNRNALSHHCGAGFSAYAVSFLESGCSDAGDGTNLLDPKLRKPMKTIKFLLSIALILTVVSGVQAKEEGVRMFGIEEATIHYKMEGSMNGTRVQYFKDYGKQLAEEMRSEMNIMGMSVKQHNRTITQGPWVVSIDLEKNTASRMRNPMYEQIKKSAAAGKGKKASERYMKAMGGTDTGKTAKYAGEKCRIWDVPRFVSKMCVTDDGLPVWHESNVAGMKSTHVATKIIKGDPGPASVYEVPKGMTVTEEKMPDLSQLQEMRKHRGKVMQEMQRERENNPDAAQMPDMRDMPDINKLMEMFKPKGQN